MTESYGEIMSTKQTTNEFIPGNYQEGYGGGNGGIIRIPDDGSKKTIFIQTTNWEEKFDYKYIKAITGNEELHTKDVISLLINIKQFISDLRKKDEQQLLLKLSLETRYYGREIEMKISKIIEEYYENN